MTTQVSLKPALNCAITTLKWLGVGCCVLIDIFFRKTYNQVEKQTIWFLLPTPLRSFAVQTWKLLELPILKGAAFPIAG